MCYGAGDSRGTDGPAAGRTSYDILRKGARMLRTHTLDMTEGKPLRLLVLFAIPLLIGNLFQQAYNLADSMIVGKLLGANSLAAEESRGV